MTTRGTGERWHLVDRATREEDAVAQRFREHGWTVVPYGARTWDPEEGNADTDAMIREVRKNLVLGHGPDLIGSYPDRGVILVEVIHSGGGTERAMQLDKLLASDEWARSVPVYVVDLGHDVIWRHWPRQWREWLASNPTNHTHTGSGTWYVWLHRHNGEQNLDEWLVARS